MWSRSRSRGTWGREGTGEYGIARGDGGQGRVGQETTGGVGWGRRQQGPEAKIRNLDFILRATAALWGDFKRGSAVIGVAF